MHNFKKLKIWSQSRELVKRVYLLTENFPKAEKYNLTSQILRSAYSISSNIAEGSSRNSAKEFARYLEIALGSAYELETQLILSSDLGFINSEDVILTDICEIQKMIYSFKNKLKS